MPRVVVSGAIIECSHGGRLRVVKPGSPKLAVDGNGALVTGMETGFAFVPGAPGVLVPCPIQTTTTPPAPSPCTSTLASTSGIATKLAVAETPVLLDTASGQTVNAQSPGTWKVADPGQGKLGAT